MTTGLRLAGIICLFGLTTCSGPTEPELPELDAVNHAANEVAPGVVVIAAGDIGSCSSSSNDEGTANLIDSLVSVHSGAVVLPLGDVVYDKGTATEFQNCYQPTWGRHKARSRPAVGNHEYETAGAKGYFDYFNGVGVANGPAGDRTKGYYSYDVGRWHVVVLNSNNSFVPSKGGSTQDKWLKADLAATSQPCILAYWHHARFASSRNNPLPSPPSYTQAFWNALYNAGADLILVAHQHFYERFAPQDPSGKADPVNGIRQFVVGTGGRSVTPMTVIRPNSQVMNGNTFGVLKVTLRDGSYDWEFIPVKGKTFRDSGTGNCKGSPVPVPNQPPVASFNHSCTGLTCTFTGTSTDPDGTIVARTWSFGDGATSNVSPTTHTYTAGGSYNVQLTVTDDRGATGSTTKTITVSAPNQAPTAAFDHSCSGLSCSFTDGSSDPDGTIASWSWDFGDGASSSSRNPNHTYTQSGNYTVRLTVTDNGGATNFVTQSVSASGGSSGGNQSPNADFTRSCTDLDCQFTDASSDPDGSIDQRSWDFGDGGNSSATDPSHSYAEAGTYTVQLTVTDNDGATNSTTRTFQVSAGSSGSNQSPSANFSHACSGLSCDFTDSSSDPDGTVVQHSWDFGDGTPTSNSQNPTHPYTQAGSYTVRLTVTDNGGATNSTTRTVSVNAPNQSPTAGFTHACSGPTCDFTDTSTDPNGDNTIVSWSWTFGDGNSANTRNPSHTYGAGGNYTVRLTVTDDRGATGTVTRTVSAGSANQSPTASFSNSCNGLSCSFTDGSTDSDGTIASRSWDFGDGTGATTQNPSHTYAAANTYTVRLTVTDNGGATGTTTRSVTVTAPPPGPNQSPTANFNRSCTGPSCVFTDTSTDPDGTIAAWSWQFGDGNTSTQQHPTHTYGNGGTYTIRLTVTDNRGGTATVSKVETVIVITATGRIANGARVVDLTWAGAKTTNVDIHRGGVKIVTTANDGAHTDNVGGSGSATHQYRVCNAGSTAVCSAVATVQF